MSDLWHNSDSPASGSESPPTVPARVKLETRGPTVSLLPVQDFPQLGQPWKLASLRLISNRLLALARDLRAIPDVPEETVDELEEAAYRCTGLGSQLEVLLEDFDFKLQGLEILRDWLARGFDYSKRQ